MRLNIARFSWILVLVIGMIFVTNILRITIMAQLYNKTIEINRIFLISRNINQHGKEQHKMEVLEKYDWSLLSEEQRKGLSLEANQYITESWSNCGETSVRLFSNNSSADGICPCIPPLLGRFSSLQQT